MPIDLERLEQITPEIEEIIRSLETEAGRDVAKNMLLELARLGTIPTARFFIPQTPSCRFYDFIRDAWHIVEPAPFVDGWHIGAMAEHLEAVILGQIQNLIINVPPRSSKSLLSSVLWPAWTWTFRPEKRFLTASWDSGLSTEHSWRARLLIQSQWYQERWGDVVQITSDQNLKTRYDNNRLGYRLVTSVGSSAIGRGGNIVHADDPNPPDTQHNTQKNRAKVNSWWDLLMSMRLNDKAKDSRVVIQQRVDVDDLTGHILQTEPDEWVQLLIAMEYERSRRTVNFYIPGQVPEKVKSLPPARDTTTDPTSEQQAAPTIEFVREPPPNARIFWQDPRTIENELLNPGRFDRKAVDRDKNRLGPWGTAGQLQQRPFPMGGGLFKRSWFKFVDVIPRKIHHEVRFWDMAATEGSDNPDAAFTVGLRMCQGVEDGLIYIRHVVRGQWGPDEVALNLKQTADADGPDVRIREEREGGSSGKVVIVAHTKLLIGYNYKGEIVNGNKIERAGPFQVQCSAGNVRLLRGEWNQAYLDEMENFPGGHWKDQADASSGAFKEVVLGDWDKYGGVF